LDLFLPTHCRCRVLLLNLITHNDAYTLVRTPLDEGSDRSRDLYLHNTQLSQEPDTHASGGIRIHNPNKRVAAYLRLWPRDQQDRPCGYVGIYLSVLLHAALLDCEFNNVWHSSLLVSAVAPTVTCQS